MAPVTPRRCKSLCRSEHNFDSFRTMSEVKRKKSFKDTLRRTRMKFMDLNRIKVVEEPMPWHTFPSISHRKKEFDLEQKIDLEIKMREGTTKLLAACHHPLQSLEAAKTLLTSNERMTSYLGELQRRKLESPLENGSVRDCRLEPCRSRVCVTDIRMPLIWKDSDHFKNKGDYRRFAVFCLLKIGTEIYDTSMISKVDRSMTDMSFEDAFVFTQVPHDFEFHLEIYAHVLQDDLSIASTPLKIRHRINDSLSRTVGRKLAASLKDELAATNLGPRFDLVARATLRLEDVDDNIRTHDLIIENRENPVNQLPLFGHFCCRLAAQPDILVEDGMAGCLTVKKDGDQSQKLWGVLKGIQLLFWSSSDEACCGASPVFSIPITKDTMLENNAADESMATSITIRNVSYNEEVVYYLEASDKENTTNWHREFESTKLSHATWKHVAETMMEIQSPVVRRLPLFPRSRKGSLYERTPLKDSPNPATSLFGSTSSTSGSSPIMIHRSRSSSLSSSTSSSSSCTRLSLPQTRTRHRLSCHETSV